ncbi:hypothetical protein SASPL_116377 [Salvia splendens]|uniref:Uncharacterized protein n=1 Tax=Salvia splendens TaxID=180675 RepID=A0A8X8XSV1_SALSN|nr:hypothetical protein SASPL_116377 [Salvia splendens]
MTNEDCYDKSMADEDRCDKSTAAGEDSSDKSTADENRRRWCAFIFSFIVASAITGGVIAFYLFLMARPMHIDIQQLYIREDSSNSSNPSNTSIVIDLKFKNPLYTDDLNVTLYCSSCQSFSAMGYRIVPGFNYFSGTAHREAVVVPSGPSWDDAQPKLAQGSTVELRVEITTNFISSVDCRDCSSVEERGKCYCTGCGAATPVKVVAGFLLEDSSKVSRIS